MPDPPTDVPEPAAGSPHLDLALVREFDNRSSLWRLEDPEHLRGLLQILDPPLVERLDFTRARRTNRSFIPADLQENWAGRTKQVGGVSYQFPRAWTPPDFWQLTRSTRLA